MASCTSTLRSLLFAATLGTLLMVTPSFAQQTPGQPSEPPAETPAASQVPAAPRGPTPAPIMQPQPTTVPNRPDIPNAEIGAKLRGIAPPPIPAAPDQLPIAEKQVPAVRGDVNVEVRDSRIRHRKRPPEHAHLIVRGRRRLRRWRRMRALRGPDPRGALNERGGHTRGRSTRHGTGARSRGNKLARF